ncbi:MAG: class I SAM-dependent methyltransferase [Mucinivorans sp.]
MELTLIKADWSHQYELIDSGDGQKLERFGSQLIARPEPQALWRPSLPKEQWAAKADATFLKAKGSEEKGQWQLKSKASEQWWVEYQSKKKFTLKFRLGLTSFKHIGLFPEQASNWDFIFERVVALRHGGTEKPEVLNLFAYTGGASLAAAVAGATVTHVDSVRQTVSWSRQNYEALPQGTAPIKWVVEDALKFTLRELRRGKLYHGIILDPPSYGRGADGEKWVLTENIEQMLRSCSALLAPGGFLVLNLYSMGLSALLARTLVRSLFPQSKDEQMGELYAEDSFGKQLPLGVFLRF